MKEETANEEAISVRSSGSAVRRFRAGGGLESWVAWRAGGEAGRRGISRRGVPGEDRCRSWAEGARIERALEHRSGPCIIHRGLRRELQGSHRSEGGQERAISGRGRRLSRWSS